MRVLFLIQSCNQDRFLAEEEIIRNTWGGRLRDNCDIMFYRGDGDDTLDGGVLKLNCEDDLNHTFLKTLRALFVFQNSNEYDFIIRTNTSTWINVELLLNTLCDLDPNDRKLYGGSIVSNSESQGLPFLRGNFLVINKMLLKDIFESVKEKYYSGVDDVCLAMNLFKYYQDNNIDYLNTLRLIDNFTYRDDSADLKCALKYVGIRCGEYIKQKGNSDILYKIDEYYLNKNKCKIKKVDKIETVFGDLDV